MPLRISLPWGVTLRRSFIVKMYWGAMSDLSGNSYFRCGGRSCPVLLRWLRVPQAPALRRRPPAARESPRRALRGRMAGEAVAAVSGLGRRTARAARAGAGPGGRPAAAEAGLR